MSLPNPFDPKTVLLARHAQHVVLIHFPIALFISGVALGWLGQWKSKRSLLDAGYYNLVFAAILVVPTIATGLLAWQIQLEGQPLKGPLLLHLVYGWLSAALIWLVWWSRRSLRKRAANPSALLIALEFAAMAIVAFTGHLGGFVSGVNAPN
jgi:uncharacterized membrane protein